MSDKELVLEQLRTLIENIENSEKCTFEMRRQYQWVYDYAVSYTHLTLPTILLV